MLCHALAWITSFENAFCLCVCVCVCVCAFFFFFDLYCVHLLHYPFNKVHAEHQAQIKARVNFTEATSYIVHL